MTKSELRKKYLEKRSRLTVAETVEMSGAIAERFFAEVDLAAVRNVHTFIRLRKFNEIDTSNIYFRLWRDHPHLKTFAPRMNAATGELESVRFDAETDFTENDWGIREPLGDAADSAELDLVIVPLLCFDTRGHRVGYGKGFYDRFLARCRSDCQKVGVSYFPPETEVSDTTENDIPLDACVTPNRLFRF
ncbi:MAG: 5-formyltetrahydrofolate cyclo-ligase [Acidobacteriota bacterium]|nr:MAG: 5-formyltetrahydrofolate cyclo-ligase [Acidobacteriota bacterium]